MFVTLSFSIASKKENQKNTKMKYFFTLLGIAALVTIVLSVEKITNKIHSNGSQFAFFNSCSQGIKGNGEVTEETREVPHFSNVSVSSGIKATLKKSEKEQIIVKTDRNLQEYIKTEGKEGNLHVYISGHVQEYKDLSVVIYYKDIEEIKVSTAANIECLSKINNDILKIKASTAGEIRLKEVQTQKLIIACSSASRIHIGGNTHQLTAKSSSASALQLLDLQTTIANVKATSASNIKMFAGTELKAKATSGASIRYKGTPSANISIETSSGGSISPIK